MRKPACLRHPTVALICPACVGRKGGKVTSPAKTVAARANARRPRPGRALRFDERRGRWVLRGRDATGKQYSRSFRSERDAHRFLAMLRTRRQADATEGGTT